MEQEYWRPITQGNYWYIALLPKNASIEHRILPSTKKKRIGRITGKGTNYYDKAWTEANKRNRKINSEWVDR